jgi:heptaprenyl diphosphate synthase
VFGPVARDLETVEKALRSVIDEDPAEVSEPMQDLFQAGGKRLRPALVLLAASCGSYDLERLMPAAMAVELTHAATLVHDDVIDRSATRRGRPTVAASLGDEPAIVIGDHYFAKAYELAARSESTEVVAVLARAVMDICAGEVRQQAIRYVYTTRKAEYMDRIRAKTATLLAASCEIGALLARLETGRRDALRNYGLSLGMAFQIVDDVLDYTESEKEIGKPISHDIAEGFATLPLMLATEDAETNDQLSHLLHDGRKLTAEEAAQVVALVRASGAPKQALSIAAGYSSVAMKQLETLPPGAARDALASLTDYVVSRKL